MPIEDKDLKILWGRAAGRCSKPECHADLTAILEESGPIVLGEMAHVIGRKPGAARSDVKIGADDTYANLILLCPTHHTLIDKAPADFPIELLGEWKQEWERQVAALDTLITSRQQLLTEIARRLTQNNAAFAEWGPTSDRAERHPQSCQAAGTWQLRKLSVIVPNNRSIVNLLNANPTYLTLGEWRLAAAFIEHAEFYERHCYNPADKSAYLAFPKAFAEFAYKEASNGGA